MDEQSKPEFKLIIAGSRGFDSYRHLESTMAWLLESETLKDRTISIVCGMARGADLLGYRYALEYNHEVHKYPADWNKYGKRAGFLRNEEMGRFADGLLAFWDGKSPGTRHMINFIYDRKKPVHISEDWSVI